MKLILDKMLLIKWSTLRIRGRWIDEIADGFIALQIVKIQFNLGLCNGRWLDRFHQSSSQMQRLTEAAAAVEILRWIGFFSFMVITFCWMHRSSFTVFFLNEITEKNKSNKYYKSYTLICTQHLKVSHCCAAHLKESCMARALSAASLQRVCVCVCCLIGSKKAISLVSLSSHFFLLTIIPVFPLGLAVGLLTSCSQRPSYQY